MSKIPFINGSQPSWANLEVVLSGLRLSGITKISYTEEEEMENIYGAGNTPIARGYGNISVNVNITLLRGTVEKLREQSPTGRLQDIPLFDIVAMYIPDKKTSNVIKCDKIRNCSIKNDNFGIAQNDLKEEVELQIIASEIERKV